MSAPHYVAPAPKTLDLPAIDAQGVDVSAVWQPSAHVAETGTPVHRAAATVIRSTPIMVFLAIAGIPVAWWAQAGWVMGLGIVVGMALAGYLAVLWLDLVHNSPGSTERHRVNAAASLKRQELRQNHELRRAIVEAYLDRLERDQ